MNKINFNSVSTCKHIWEEDERFADGSVMMFAGKIGEVEQETRMICRKCKSIDYVKKVKHG